MSELTLGQKLTLLGIFVLGTGLAVGSWISKTMETHAHSMEAGRQALQTEHDGFLTQAKSRVGESTQALIDNSNEITEGHLDAMKEHRKIRRKFETIFREEL